MKKLTKSQERIMEHLREQGNVRGYTLGRGRPNDRRVIQQLIDGGVIKRLHSGRDLLTDCYAVSGEEDEHGIALLCCPMVGTIHGASHYGVPIVPMQHVIEGPLVELFENASQNGIDTALECYGPDDDRYDWMVESVTRASFEMLVDSQR